MKGSEMSYEVIVLGVGDAFSERHSPASLLLVCDGFHLAIDCPCRYRAVLAAASRRWQRPLPLAEIDDFVITHVHGDHMDGLEDVGFYKHFVESRRIRLITSPEVRDVIWDRRLAASMGSLWDGTGFQQKTFVDYFDYLPLSWTSEVQVGPLQVRIRRTIHHVPTAALVITAGTRSVGYSSDTAFDPGLIEFLAPADLIIHETGLGPAHTSYADLAGLPADLRARMRLIHYPDGLETASLQITPLQQGDVLDL
jgi:ribonuclease BN (tRNA processing enzyme)